MSETTRTTTMLLDAGPFLNPLARRLANGEHADLLAPFRRVDPSQAPPLASPALEAPELAERRRALAAALEARNRELGHPQAAELAERLAEPATRVVITGQQPGLFGGPLYALSKLLAAVRWAERLEAEGTPALAVFWMATEDHDFAEVARCSMPIGEQGEIVHLELPDDGRDLVPVGKRALGPAVSELVDRLVAGASGDRQVEWAERLGAIYAPERTFGEAFAALMIELLGARCPLLVDALDPAFKRVQAEVLRRLVDRREEVGAALVARDAEIEARGLPHQVSPQPADCSPLFLLDDETEAGRDAEDAHRSSGRSPCRRRLLWEERDGTTGFGVRGGGAGGSLDELRRILELQPERVGPGALARPVVQDALFGTAAFLVGPGELAYLTQASVLYPVLGVSAPVVALRPQMLVVDERRQSHLAELMERGLDPGAILGSDEDLEAALASIAGSDPLEPALAEVLEAVDRLRGPAIGIDPQLESPWEKTRGQVGRALEALAGRAQAARARSDGVLRQRVEALRRICLPGGVLQERKVAVGHFPGLYGEDVALRLLAQLELSAGSIQLLDPTDGEATRTVAAAGGAPATASER